MATKRSSAAADTGGDTAPAEPDTAALAQAPAEPPAALSAPEPEPEETRPHMARMEWPDDRMVLPGGGPTAEDGTRVDLVITRDGWTEVPADQVSRLKNTARRAGARVRLMIPEEK